MTHPTDYARAPVNQMTPVDECSNRTHNCDINATCADTQGSYTCTCNAGFTGDGLTCEPAEGVDECSLGTHNCHANASCTDTEGSFLCSCDIGYDGDGVDCGNINECLSDVHNCHANASCTDTDG